VDVQKGAADQHRGQRRHDEERRVVEALREVRAERHAEAQHRDVGKRAQQERRA
jgi:hypothetical protein